MDQIDALFGKPPALPPGGRSASAPAQRALPRRSASSDPPWGDEDIPPAPHPSEEVSSRRGGASNGSAAAGAPRGSAELIPLTPSPACAPSLYRTPVKQDQGIQRPGQESRQQSDREPGWEDGERDDSDAERRPSEREYINVHVYGVSGALCFANDTTKKEGQTVRLEAAKSAGQRTYNWNAKIAVQFTVKELPFVLAVLMGWLPSVEFKAHGPNQDKGFSLQCQDGGKVFARVWQKTSIQVPISAQDLYPIVDLILRQMVANSPHNSADSILSVVRQMSSVYQNAGVGVRQDRPAAAA